MTKEAWGSHHPFLFLTQFFNLYAKGQPEQMAKGHHNSTGQVVLAMQPPGNQLLTSVMMMIEGSLHAGLKSLIL